MQLGTLVGTRPHRPCPSPAGTPNYRLTTRPPPEPTDPPTTRPTTGRHPPCPPTRLTADGTAPPNYPPPVKQSVDRNFGGSSTDHIVYNYAVAICMDRFVSSEIFQLLIFQLWIFGEIFPVIFQP